jgi:hypothetical protein
MSLGAHSDTTFPDVYSARVVDANFLGSWHRRPARHSRHRPYFSRLFEDNVGSLHGHRGGVRCSSVERYPIQGLCWVTARSCTGRARRSEGVAQSDTPQKSGVIGNEIVSDLVVNLTYVSHRRWRACGVDSSWTLRRRVLTHNSCHCAALCSRNTRRGS